MREYLNTTYINSYNITLNKIKDENDQKIIFVGGSNVAFGLDSERIEKETGIISINFGVHGGIGIKKLIEDISSFIKPNDIIFFSPEYSNLNLEHFESDKYHIQFINEGISSIKNFEEFKFYMIFLKSNLNQFILPKNNRAYNINWFNSNGDVIGHHDMESIPVSKIFQNTSIGQEELKELKKYIENKIRTTTWFLIPPVTHEDRFNLKTKKELNNNLKMIFGDKYPLPIETQTFKADCFFDSQYHLNFQCKKIRTDIILNFIHSLNLNLNKF